MPYQPQALPTVDLLPAVHETTSAELASLLGDFGGDDWDIVWLEDGRLGGRPRNGNPRPAGPFVLVADTPAQMRNLLESAPPACGPEANLRCGNAFPLGPIAEAIISRLRESGLDVREQARSGPAVDVVVTNPRRPGNGHVVIDRNGLIEWNRYRQATDQLVIAHMTNAVICLLTTSGDRGPDRSGPRGDTCCVTCGGEGTLQTSPDGSPRP
jgi:hypothetical protein